jgi:hypothetical protein
MPKYWVRRSDGKVTSECVMIDPPGHSRFELIEGTLPGPMETCVWDGAAFVFDASRLNERKRELREAAVGRLYKPISVTVGGNDFTLDAAQRNAITSMETKARERIAASDTTWTLRMRTDAGAWVDLPPVAILEVCERIGLKMRLRWNNIAAKLEWLESATAAQINAFDPDVA